MAAVEHRGDGEHRDDRHGEQPPRPSGEQEPAGDRERGEDPPAHDAGPRRPARSLVTDVGLEERVDAVQVDGAQDARGDDLRDVTEMIPRVVERRVALAGTAHRRVDVDVVRRMLEHALDRPTTLVRPEERGVAVGAEQGRAVVGRQQGGTLEADEVGDDPGHQDGDRGGDEHSRAGEPSTDPDARHLRSGGARSPSPRASGRTGPARCAPSAARPHNTPRTTSDRTSVRPTTTTR